MPETTDNFISLPQDKFVKDTGSQGLEILARDLV
jgi:hypothetical protein